MNARITSAISRKLSAMAEPSVEDLREHGIQVRTDPGLHGDGEMGVYLGGAYAGVPQKHLYHADVDAAFQEARGKGVAKAVKFDFRAEADAIARAAERSTEGPVGKVISAAFVGEQPFSMAVGAPESPPVQEQRFRKRHDPLPVALADKPHDHLPGIDGADRQGDGIVDPQSQDVHAGAAEAVHRLVDGCHQAPAIVRRERDRKAHLPGLAHLLFREESPINAEAAIEEKLEPVKVCLERALGHAPLIAQPEDIVVHLLLGEAIRTHTGMPLQHRNRGDVTLLRAERKSCQMHIPHHPQPERRYRSPRNRQIPMHVFHDTRTHNSHDSPSTQHDKKRPGPRDRGCMEHRSEAGGGGNGVAQRKGTPYTESAERRIEVRRVAQPDGLATLPRGSKAATPLSPMDLKGVKISRSGRI